MSGRLLCQRVRRRKCWRRNARNTQSLLLQSLATLVCRGKALLLRRLAQRCLVFIQFNTFHVSSTRWGYFFWLISQISACWFDPMKAKQALRLIHDISRGGVLIVVDNATNLTRLEVEVVRLICRKITWFLKKRYTYSRVLLIYT